MTPGTDAMLLEALARSRAAAPGLRIRIDPAGLRIEGEAAAPADILLPEFAFPGWSLAGMPAGAALGTDPATGLLRLALPAGRGGPLGPARGHRCRAEGLDGQRRRAVAVAGRAGPGAPDRAAARPGRRMTAASPWPRRWAIGLLAGAALLLHLGLVLGGVYRLEADVERAVADGLECHGTMRWSPGSAALLQDLVGLFLRLYGDVSLAPRILAALAGTGTLLVLVGLSQALFRNHLVDVATAALAVVVPDLG